MVFSVSYVAAHRLVHAESRNIVALNFDYVGS